MKTAHILICYGLFLIVAGLAGYLSNPEKAKTALIMGGGFGLIQIGIGIAAQKNWMHARRVGLGICTMLAVVFVWRSTASWMAVAGGQSEKLFAASLISTMLVASVAAILLLLKQKTLAQH